MRTSNANSNVSPLWWTGRKRTTLCNLTARYHPWLIFILQAQTLRDRQTCSYISGDRRTDRYGTAAVTGWNVRKGENGKGSQSAAQQNLGDVTISFYCAGTSYPAMLVMTWNKKIYLDSAGRILFKIRRLEEDWIRSIQSVLNVFFLSDVLIFLFQLYCLKPSIHYIEISRSYVVSSRQSPH